MKRILFLIIIVGILIASSNVHSALFSDNFESDDLNKWDTIGSGQIVNDPDGGSNNVLNFGQTAGGGDIFSKSITLNSGSTYNLSFDYFGDSDGGGGFIGLKDKDSEDHWWMAGTKKSALTFDDSVQLNDDDSWGNY